MLAQEMIAVATVHASTTLRLKAVILIAPRPVEVMSREITTGSEALA
jgi:hypothetical protein